ncbi:hypothetical protein ACP4OV_007144 [Aristida adscensionis]
MVGVHLCRPPPPPCHAAPPATTLPANSSGPSFLRSFPGLKTKQARTTTARLRLAQPRCAAAGSPCEPNPEPEEDPITAQYRRYREKMDKFSKEYGAALRAVYGGSEEDALVEELEATLFRVEEEKIHTYKREIASSSSFLYEEGRRLATMVCSKIRMAIYLSAMANAHLKSGGSSGISFQTTERSSEDDLFADDPEDPDFEAEPDDTLGEDELLNQGLIRQAQWIPENGVRQVNPTVRTYVSTFLKIAEDTSHRKVDRASIISFLDALRGLAAISHILVEDTLAAASNIEDGSSNYSPMYDVEALHHELKRNLKQLEMNFAAAPDREARKNLYFTLNDATKQVSLFLTRMTSLRKDALDYISAYASEKEHVNDKEHGSDTEHVSGKEE